MGKAVLLSGDTNGETVADGRYMVFGGTCNDNTDEALRQIYTTGVTGTFSQLGLKIDSTGTSRSLTFRKNTANGNQSITIADAASGWLEDAVNTDSLADGDDFSSLFNESGTNPDIFALRVIFESDSGHVSFIGGQSGILGQTASTTFYHYFFATSDFTQTEANTSTKARAVGTLSGFAVYLSSNGRSSDTPAYVRINTANGNQTVTLTASTTGLFQDTTNTDTLSDGDLWTWSTVNGTGSGFPSGYATIQLDSSNTSNEIFSKRDQTRAASATVHYGSFAGQIIHDHTTEAEPKIQHGIAVDTSNLRCYVPTNTYSAAATLRMRKNGANGNQSVSITASTTGWFEDSVNTDSFGATDDMNWSIVGGTTGSITTTAIGITETPGAAVAVGSLLYKPMRAVMPLLGR